MACDFQFIVESKGLQKVIGSRVHCKVGSIMETVQSRDAVTTGY